MLFDSFDLLNYYFFFSSKVTCDVLQYISFTYLTRNRLKTYIYNKHVDLIL